MYGPLSDDTYYVYIRVHLSQPVWCPKISSKSRDTGRNDLIT